MKIRVYSQSYIRNARSGSNFKGAEAAVARLIDYAASNRPSQEGWYAYVKKCGVWYHANHPGLKLEDPERIGIFEAALKMAGNVPEGHVDVDIDVELT